MWLIDRSLFLLPLLSLLSTPTAASPDSHSHGSQPHPKRSPSSSERSFSDGFLHHPNPRSQSPDTRHPHPHNLNHPHRSLLKRSLTTDAASISGSAFDFVIAGGGVAGLALAARLSEWSNVTVLVIEAGGNGTDVEDQIDIPGYSYLHSLTNSAYDWAYKTVAQTDNLNRVMSWPRGRGLGGSGAINGLFWCRGDSTEYDAWASLNPDGEQTWDWAEITKYINKAENFSQPDASVQNEFGMVLNASAHGSGGPIQSGFSEYIFAGVANWIPTWVSLGFTAMDLAGGNTHGVMITPSTLNMHNQTRSDSKAGYIDPLPPRSNLVILTGQQVTQVIFNGSTDASGNVIASGVKFQASSGATSYSVQANKEVILCGGTVGSAQILQLSGVGPSSLMTELGITSKLDLPVGYNLQDHVSYSMYWNTPQGTLTWNNLSVSSTLQSEQLTEYENDRTGMWTYINEAVGYPSMTDITGSSSAASTYASTVTSALASTVSQVTSWQSLPSNVATGLAAQYALQAEWLTQDIGQLEIILTMLGNGGNQVGIQVALQHPWSRGTVLINSTDPFTQPAINPDYFGVGYDIDIMGYGSEFARTLAATSPLSTLMTSEYSPGTSYTGDSLANYTKQNCGTEYHPLGTCAMLPKASGGVVDTNLLVYGSSNLRVIDASIMPLQLSAHLMATSYGVAEKGADIIKSKYMADAASTSNTTTTGATTATVGKATDTSVTDANSNSGSSSSSLSDTAKIGIGVGAGVGAAVILGALILFCLRRKKNKRGPAEKGWYNPGPAAAAATGAASAHGVSGAYKEPAYAMNDLPPAPVAPYAHQRSLSNSPSVATMATGDLMTSEPMRSESAYDMGAYSRGGAASPYRDSGEFDDNHYGYPTSPRGSVSQGSEQQQRYHPVQIR